MQFDTTTLLKKIIETLSKEDEVYKIYSFGSVVTGVYDKYSDIDITVVTSDLAKTSSDIFRILNNVDEVLATFTLFETEKSGAYTVFFKNLSLFQKIDIGIENLNQTEFFENSKLEYKKTKVLTQNLTQLISRGESEIDHNVLDTFIGALRYLKYIKRKQIWPAYKFYKSFIETYLKTSLDLNTESKLDLESYKNIQDKLGNRYTELILLESTTDMTKVYLKYLKKYLSEYRKQISKENLTLTKKIIELFYGEVKR